MAPFSTCAGTRLEQQNGECFPLTGNCTIGRSSSCDLVVANTRVSRQHATIHAQDLGEFWLIDLGSSNGTQLNHRRVVRPVKLQDGDVVTIADSSYTFRQDSEAVEASGSKTGGSTVLDVHSEKRWMLLADLEGFTPLSQRLAPEELATLVGRWVRAGREIVEGHGGSLNKYLGDGYLACWPGRPESPAQVAEAIKAFHEQWATAEPKFRIVVHQGIISVGGAAAASFGEESLMGPEINFLFRVEKVAAAAGAPFCFTTAARQALGDALPLVQIPGQHALKGFPGSYEFFKL